MHVRRRARVIAFKKIAPRIALCIFELARGHPERTQEQGLVLRSSADETGCLLSAGNKMARLIGRRSDRRPNELHRATRGLVGS
jgi:hypothetical protein